MPRISSKNQVTIPASELRRIGLAAEDEVEVIAEEPDAIVIRRAGSALQEGLGVFDGMYGPGYLERLRSGERH